MQIGFIGVGSMGSALIRGLIRSGEIAEEQIILHNRSKDKLEALKKTYSSLSIAANNREVASRSDILFLCVRPMQFADVLQETNHLLRPEQILVSVTSSVSIEALEERLICKVLKIIPSITNAVGAGACIVFPGSRLSASDMKQLLHLISHFGKPMITDEQYTRITSDLSSCGPAFVSFFLEELAKSATAQTGIPKEQAIELVEQMLIGMGKLLQEEQLTLASLRERVCVPGGITLQALQVLQQEMDGCFDNLIRFTQAKFSQDVARANQMFDSWDKKKRTP